MKNTTITLVGAGCGTREWVTLEGLEAIRSCDALVYDDLIDETLLEEAPAAAEKIYVGKRMNGISTKQETILDLLADLSTKKQSIVRLKGGDPFVFGRGGEEALFFKERGIVCHVVPGISSAIAIPEQAGIPVTHRGLSRSFHVMTAHTKEDRLRQDLAQFAHLEGTLVFLMGLNSLSTICAQLVEFGRAASTPAAVVSGGNSTGYRKVVGNLETLPTLAKDVCAPAVIIVGEVCTLNLTETRQQVVGLTGTDAFQGKLRKELRKCGIDSVSLMKGYSTRINTPIPFEMLCDGTERWLVFSSVRGVERFFEECQEREIDHRAFAACRFAVIGGETNKALRKFGFCGDLCPEKFNSEFLSTALVDKIGKKKTPVHILCSRQGTDNVENALQKAGIPCTRHDLYDTVMICRAVPAVKLSHVLFGSAEGVRTLYRSGYRFEGDTKALCIGPICAKAFEDCYGFQPLMSEEALVSSMVKSLTL